MDKFGTLIVGSDKYALKVVEKINDRTFVAVHLNDDGTCFTFDDGFPWIEILRKKQDGRLCTDGAEFIEGETHNYSDPSF